MNHQEFVLLVERTRGAQEAFFAAKRAKRAPEECQALWQAARVLERELDAAVRAERQLSLWES